MAARGIVAVVGSRQLPSSFALHVSSLVGFFVERGWGIGSGGARGADTFALQAVLAMGPEACQQSLVCLPGRSTRALVRAFARRGGRFVAGSGTGRAALLARSRRLVQASAGVVAFLWGPSRGSVFTVRQAVRSGKPAAVVLAGGRAELPAFVETMRRPSAAMARLSRYPSRLVRMVRDSGGMPSDLCNLRMGVPRSRRERRRQGTRINGQEAFPRLGEPVVEMASRRHRYWGQVHEPRGETVMTRTIKARFSHGVFEPLEPAVGELVKEGEEVTITIETASATSAGDPLRETAGGWRGLIDAEALKAAIYRDRELVTRPPVRMRW